LRKLHNQEIYDLYFSPNIQVPKSRRKRWEEYVAHMGARRCAYMVLVGNLDGRRPLGGPRRR
jgi:hypothetical protein